MTTSAVGFINFAAELKADSKSELASRTDEAFAALTYAGKNKAQNCKIWSDNVRGTVPF